MDREAVAARWGALILAKRHEHDPYLRQTALADSLGIGQGLISAWETGRAVPSTQNQARLIAALGITGDELAAIYAEDVAA